MNILRMRRKSKKKPKLKSLILLLFTLIMTTFAWFAYSKVLNTTLNLHIAGWDLKYYIDDIEQTDPNAINIQIPELYPAMDEEVIRVDIKNNGEALIDLGYQVKSITIAAEESYELVTEGGTNSTVNYINIGTPVLETDAETGELLYKGDIINEPEKFPFTVKVEHLPQIYPNDDAYLSVTVSWAGDNDELDSEWGYKVGKYLEANPSESAMSITLSIDSYQAEGEIQAGTGSLPNGTGTRPYLPSSDYTLVGGTDLDTGLVIKDSTGNEYVWIEVPKVLSVYPTAGINITEFTDDEYTKIENDLHTYTTAYRSGVSNTDTYYSDETTGLTSDEYDTLKKKMLKSVYQNGGFYIARYEAGTTTNRTNHTSITGLTALSQPNKYPLNWVTCSEAQELAEKVATDETRTSSLMFGVQWDLVQKYIENKAVDQGIPRETIQGLLKTNSTTWGNYNSTTYNITNTNAKYSTNNGSAWGSITTSLDKTSAGTIFLTTGAANIFAKQNIFDFAGNVWEWTLEYSGNTTNTCTIRGGAYESTSSENNANYRNSSYGTFSYYSLGFRVTIY